MTRAIGQALADTGRDQERVSSAMRIARVPGFTKTQSFANYLHGIRAVEQYGEATSALADAADLLEESAERLERSPRTGDWDHAQEAADRARAAVSAIRDLGGE